MENTNIKLHQYQKQILKKLTGFQNLRFNDLLIEGLGSEHMNYHLKQLVLLDFVEKVDERYCLTDKGKDYTNLLDDDIEIIEKQPKTSIVINGVRLNKETQEIEHLLNKRLRHPYYGKVGRLTGKVRFGETFEEAAKRELFEETGLTATTFELETIYRKMRKREDGTFIQDVVFYIFFVKDFAGDFIEKTGIQENFWMSKEEIERRGDMDLYDDMYYNQEMKPSKLKVVESIDIATGF